MQKKKHLRLIVPVFVIVVVVLVFGVGFIHARSKNQTQFYTTESEVKTTDALTSDKTNADWTVHRYYVPEIVEEVEFAEDDNLSESEADENLEELNLKCDTIAEAEDTLNFRIAQPQIDTYEIDSVYAIKDGGTHQKAIWVSYIKEDGSIEMEVGDMSKCKSWTFSYRPYKVAETEDYTNAYGYELTVMTSENKWGRDMLNVFISFSDYYVFFKAEKVSYEELTGFLDTIDFKLYEGVR